MMMRGQSTFVILVYAVNVWKGPIVSCAAKFWLLKMNPNCVKDLISGVPRIKAVALTLATARFFRRAESSAMPFGMISQGVVAMLKLG